MKIGDKVYEPVSFGDTQPVMAHGRVVYIHPQRKFYIAEFEFERGKFRETYHMNETERQRS